MKLWLGLGLVVVLIFAGAIFIAMDDTDLNSVVATSEGPTPVPEGQPQPKAEVVGGEFFDFGHDGPDSKGSHTFEIKNVGQGELVLHAGQTSCKCTISGLKKTRIAPGESGEVTVDWHLAGQDARFRQIAPILTNDRSRPRIELVIYGQIMYLAVVDPKDVSMGMVPSEKGGMASAVISSPAVDEFKITGHRTAEEGMAKFFDCTYERLTDSKELEARNAKYAYRVNVQVKPGLPLGRFNQKITFLTDIEKAPEISLLIVGNVVGSISIAGGEGKWSDETGVLSLETVDANLGTKTEMRMYIRGQHQNVKVNNILVDPVDVLRVKIGKLEPSRNGKTSVLPFTVEIPPGTRPVNRLGSTQGPLAGIVFETDHPETPIVKVMVRFAVEAN